MSSSLDILIENIGQFDPAMLYGFLPEEVRVELNKRAVKNFYEVVTAKMTQEQIEDLKKRWEESEQLMKEVKEWNIFGQESSDKLRTALDKVGQLTTTLKEASSPEEQLTVKTVLDKMEQVAVTLREKTDELSTLASRHKAQSERLEHLATQVHTQSEVLLANS